ncbi:MAG: hypothetical protein GY815_00170 [Gammaproteobacteria bacterium]|nr:hypothetical protein [Gammaproteobacteria bacterium]
MHGQSGESVGINTAREYFEFARNLAFLDATGHQANDFQINNAFWQQVNDLSAEFHEDHRFLTLPGYEWSGNTAVGDDRVTWDTITTGNFGGFDAWVEAGADARLVIDSNHVSGRFTVDDIGLDEVVLDGGGLERKIRIFRLPTRNDCRELMRSVEFKLKPVGDNPIWVRVTTEDGFNAWSSPIFIYREAAAIPADSG